MNLKELEIGKSAIVTSVGGDGALRQHFLDMGIIPGVEVSIVKFAPRGDPMEVRIHGYELTLRLADAEKITVVPASEYEAEQDTGVKNRLLSLGRGSQKAFTVILLASIVIWLLKSFDFRFNFVVDSRNSILAAICGLVAPIFKPLGLGDWRIVTSLVSGVMAKESVVSVMEVLFKAEGGAAAVITPLAAIAMLVFCLLAKMVGPSTAFIGAGAVALVGILLVTTLPNAKKAKAA